MPKFRVPVSLFRKEDLGTNVIFIFAGTIAAGQEVALGDPETFQSDGRIREMLPIMVGGEKLYIAAGSLRYDK